MRKCRRTISIAMVLLLAVSMLSACGSATATASSDPAPVAVQQEVQPAKEATKPAEEAPEVKEEPAPTAESAPEVIEVVEETPVHVPPTIITTTELTDIDGIDDADNRIRIQHCVDLGIMRADADGQFHPDDLVTKAQIAEGLYNFYDHSGYVISDDLVLEDIPREASGTLTKATDINPDACYWLADMLGPYAVSDGKFNPEQNLNAAEVVDIFYKITALTDRALRDGDLTGKAGDLISRRTAAYVFVVLGYANPVGDTIIAKYDENGNIVSIKPSRIPADLSESDKIIQTACQNIDDVAVRYGFVPEGWTFEERNSRNGIPGVWAKERFYGPYYQISIEGWMLAYKDGVSESWQVGVYELERGILGNGISEPDVTHYFDEYRNN